MFQEKIKGELSKAIGINKKEIFLQMPKPDFGDFSFPCFLFAKKEKKNPNQIAEELAKKIKIKGIKVVAVGGYVNFFIDKEEFSKKVITTIINEKINYGSGKEKGKTIVEFCHANTHKDFHIGHVRNICLGESVSRILEKLGFKVIRANYQGDVGMHVAKTIWGMLNLKKLKLKIPNKDRGKWLGIVYAKASKMAENKKIAEEINEINKKLYSGDKKLINLWRKTRKWSIDYFEKVIYPDFEVKFDRFYFESEVEKKGIKIAKSLLKKGIAKKSEGAIIIDLKKYGLDVFIILKADGTPLYSTKDLYLAELQNKEYNPNKILHVVGSEQNFYFKQLIKTLEIIKPKIAKKEKHISYELVILPSGKMASRKGIVILYDDTLNKIIELAKKEIKKRDIKIEKKELENRAKKIALGAIKYVMLSQDTTKTIVFDEKEAVQFEGNSGPYLQYAVVRANSILKKVKESGKEKQIKINFKNLHEKEYLLTRELSIFPKIINQAARDLKPNIIANYAYGLAKIFNDFYECCPVLKAKKERGRRVALVKATKQVLENCLDLLGIPIVKEM